MSSRDGSSEDKPALPSLRELQGLLRLNRVPAALTLEDIPAELPRAGELPRAEAPSLEGLTVARPTVAPVTEEDLLERLDQLKFEVAPRYDRPPGEPVALGDEVLLDVLGYSRGRLIPFAARADWWVRVKPEPLLPGFFEALVGARAGKTLELALTLPPGYPVAALRGAPAHFVVAVKAVRVVDLPDDEAPEFLFSLGRGSTLREVMHRLAQELTEERRAVAAQQAKEAVLEQLADRCSVEVPARLIEEEVRLRWAESERQTLTELELPPSELQASLDGWLRDPLTRGEAAQRLKIALVLAAIAERERLQPRREDMDSILDTVSRASKAPRTEVGAWLRADPALAPRLHNLLMHLAAVDHVMSKVVFTLLNP
jgi:trigger factor